METTDIHNENTTDSKRGFSYKLLFLKITILLCLPITILLASFTIEPLAEYTLKQHNQDTTEAVTKKKQTKKTVEKLTTHFKQKFVALTPYKPYIVVNTTYNRFKLYKNRKLIRTGFCSTGSYTLLKSQNKREWIFQTPKGLHKIQGKITSPVWRRPDWSFIEEGLPVPSKDDPSRWEAGVLGDYAMSIGNGFLIHGTIYKRFLGMPVTHGCIRMNDEDLKAVYNTLEISSMVYIF